MLRARCTRRAASRWIIATERPPRRWHDKYRPPIIRSHSTARSLQCRPLMLRTLIEKSGSAALRDIASCFLAHDESQIEYYVEITNRMPGQVLTRYQLVRRDGTGYRMIPDLQELASDERNELLRL